MMTELADIDERVERALRTEQHIAELERTIEGYAMIQGRHAEMITERDRRIAELEQANRDLNTMLQVAVAAQRAMPIGAIVSAMEWCDKTGADEEIVNAIADYIAQDGAA